MATESTTELRDAFADFLHDQYADDVVAFAEQYPTSYTFEIEWSALEAYDQSLARQYQTNPAEVQSVIDDALRFHDLHDAAYLNYARIVLTDPPSLNYPSDIRHAHTDVLTGVQARIGGVDDERTVLIDAVYQCRDCGETTIVSQSGDTVTDPYECSGCGKKRVDYDLQMEQSTTESRQWLELEDPPSLQAGGNIITMEAELIGPATGTVDVGDWVQLTGQPKYRLVGETREVEPYFEATHVTTVDPDTILGEDDAAPTAIEGAFLTPTDVDLSAAHLQAFSQHVEDVLDACSTWELNEEEGKLKLVTPLLELLGWDVYTEGVRMEYSAYTGDLDYLLFDGDDPMVCVEAKSPGELQPHHFDQLKKYMLSTEAAWGLLTDGIKYWIVANNDTRSRPTIIVKTTYELLAEYYDEFAHLTRAAIRGDR